MCQNFIDSWSSGGIIIKNLHYKVLGMISNWNCFRELIVVHSNSSIRSFDVISLKWWFSDDKGINNYTEGPDINLIRVTLFAFKYFWCNIVRCTANGSLSFTIELKLCGQTEISNLNLHLVVKEKITKFKISMNDSMGV